MPSNDLDSNLSCSYQSEISSWQEKLRHFTRRYDMPGQPSVHKKCPLFFTPGLNAPGFEESGPITSFNIGNSSDRAR